MNIKKSVIIYVIIEVLFQLLVFALIRINPTNPYSNLSSMLIASILSISFTILLAYLFRNKNKEKNDFIEFIDQFKYKRNFLVYIFAIITAISLLPISAIIQQLVNENLEKIGYHLKSTVDSIFNEKQLLEQQQYRALVIITTSVFVPIREELVFRSVLTQGLRDFGTKFAIIFGALIFGFVHGGIDQFFPQLFLGLLMGVFYFKTKDIKVTVIMHMTNNMIATCLSLYSKKESESTLGDRKNQIIFLIIAFVVLLISSLILNHLTTRKKKKVNEPYFISNKRYLWHKDEYERRIKKPKDILSYLAFFGIFTASLIMWIVETVKKAS